MENFSYSRPESIDRAIEDSNSEKETRFIAGGTNLIDLMKYRVENPRHLIDINRLGLQQIESPGKRWPTIGCPCHQCRHRLSPRDS